MTSVFRNDRQEYSGIDSLKFKKMRTNNNPHKGAVLSQWHPWSPLSFEEQVSQFRLFLAERLRCTGVQCWVGKNPVVFTSAANYIKGSKEAEQGYNQFWERLQREVSTMELPVPQRPDTIWSEILSFLDSIKETTGPTPAQDAKVNGLLQGLLWLIQQRRLSKEQLIMFHATVAPRFYFGSMLWQQKQPSDTPYSAYPGHLMLMLRMYLLYQGEINCNRYAYAGQDAEPLWARQWYGICALAEALYAIELPEGERKVVVDGPSGPGIKPFAFYQVFENVRDPAGRLLIEKVRWVLLDTDPEAEIIARHILKRLPIEYVIKTGRSADVRLPRGQSVFREFSDGVDDYFSDEYYCRHIVAGCGNLEVGGVYASGNYAYNPQGKFLRILYNWFLHERTTEQLLQLAEKALREFGKEGKRFEVGVHPVHPSQNILLVRRLS
ncbi:hypothetical protein H6771_00465 [Candidatus Peribacteria bacterium]|nr:hypothetical protein [Candidatus Peribacteria bacterium]